MAKINFYIDLNYNKGDPTYSLDWSQFYPASFKPFKEIVDKQNFFIRYGWGEMEIRNSPSLYDIASDDAYQLYDLITSLDFTQGIAVKMVTDSITIQGYFGRNDCKLDEDRNTLKITPAILDRYTDFLEGIEEEIDFSDYPLEQTELYIGIDNDNLNPRNDWKSGNYGELKIRESIFNPTNLSAALANYFDGQAPKRSLINAVSNPFTDATGQFLEHRETVLGEVDYQLSSLTIWVGETNDGVLFFGHEKRTLFCETVFSRDEYVKINVADGGEPSGYEHPPGEGWTIRNPEIVNGENGHLWTRLPFNGTSTDDWSLADEISNPRSDGGSPDFTWFKKRTTSLGYVDSVNSKTINSSIPFKDALEFIYTRTLSPVSTENELEAIFVANSNAVTLETHSIPVNESSSDYSETQAVAVNTTTPFFASSTKIRTIKMNISIEGNVTAPSSQPNLGLLVYLRIRDSEDTLIQSVQIFNNKANTANYAFSKTQTISFNLLAYYTAQIETTLYESGGGIQVNYTIADINISSTEDIYQSKNVVSTFFFNDLDDVEPIDIYEGLNYVTQKENYLNYTKIFFTSAVQQLSGTGEVDGIPLITFKDFFDDLNKLFAGQLIWDIMETEDENDGALRIEHIKYIDLIRSPVDISGEDLIDFTKNWDFDKSRMFNLLEFEAVNSGYKDFTDNKITFDNIISNNRNKDIKKEFITSKLSTDTRYAIENPSDLEQGIVLVATNLAGTDVINKIGAISGKNESNGFMAISNLLYDFGRYEGVWEDGWINGEAVEFKVTMRNKVGQELTLKGLNNDLFYQTNIGIGILDGGDIDFENETTKIKLRYRYNSDVDTDIFAIIFAEDVLADFANYET